MNKELPNISFNPTSELGINVFRFSEVYKRLNQSNSHDPFSPHKIQFYFIAIVTGGSYGHGIDFKSYKLKTGAALFIAKNQVHHFTKTIKDAEGICIVISSSFMDKFRFLSENIKLNRLFNYHIASPIISASDMGKDSFIDIADLLYKEYSNPDNFTKPEMLRTLLQVLLLRAERSKEACSNEKVKPMWLEIFSEFKTMLETDYVTNKNARSFAKKLLISYKFLNDIVKQLTGKTAKAFIDDFVTIEIKRYLAATSLSVKEISYKTGFMEPSNMVKFFKRTTTKTPLKFREEL